MFHNEYSIEKQKGVSEVSKCKALRLRAKERTWSTWLSPNIEVTQQLGTY